MTAAPLPSEGALGRESAPQKPHLDPLTSIRFFAAFHVVVYHNAQYLTTALPEGPISDLLGNAFAMGYGGVNLFFVLSGFILAYTYLEPGREPHLSKRRFWIARFARIYPVYVFSLLMVAPQVLHHFFSANPPLTAALKAGVSGLSALTLTHAWIPPFRAIWNAPGWTLSAEAFFYLLFPLLAVWIWKLERGAAVVLAGLAWLASSVPFVIALWILPDGVAWTPATDSMPPDHVATFLRIAPIFRVNEFILGIAVARAFFPAMSPGAASRPPGWAAPIALAAMVAIGIAYFLGDRIPRLLVHAGVLDPIHAALIVGLAHCGGWLRRALSARWLLLLGEASYAVYILHIPLRGWLLALLGEDRATELGPIFFLLYSAVVLAASIAAFRWLEDPARRWIRSRFSGAAVRVLHGERA